MNFNVSLSSEQIEFIASVTADKVLETVKYERNRAEWHERDIKLLKEEIITRDSMLVQRDLTIIRQREIMRKQREELKGLRSKKELTELNINITRGELQNIFYDYLKVKKEDHEVEFLRDRLIETLENAADKVLDELENQ